MSRHILSYPLLITVLLAAISAHAYSEEPWTPIGPNLVKNPSFETCDAAGFPVEWRANRTYYRADDAVAYEGRRAVRYENDDPSKYVFCNQILKAVPGAADCCRQEPANDRARPE